MRKEARALGLPNYTTGKPCKRGHICARYSSTGQCIVCTADYGVAWGAANIDKVRAYARADYWKDPASRNAKTRIWFKENPGRAAELRKEWHARNPGARVMHEATRRARKMALGGIVTKDQIASLAEKQKHKCPYCLKPIKAGFHVDHIQPLARSGMHAISNIQLLCETCNHRKHATDPFVFALQNGRLL